MGRPPSNKIGEVRVNNFGSEMRIIGYRNTHNVDVYFPQYNWRTYGREYNQFKLGTLKCPYEPRVHGVGYLGVGKYKVSVNRKNTKCYEMWENMLKRCYSNNRGKRSKSYEDCFVCEEWHNFQNFAKWYEENYYEVEGQKMCLDKDIKYKNNKVYSKETCFIVPERINTLFERGRISKKNEPMGVNYHKSKGKYVARCNVGKDRIWLGHYDTKEQAFSVYKPFKENYIKQIADEYEKLIPKELYDAMYKYEVEIDD